MSEEKKYKCCCCKKKFKKEDIVRNNYRDWCKDCLDSGVHREVARANWKRAL